MHVKMVIIFYPLYQKNPLFRDPLLQELTVVQKYKAFLFRKTFDQKRSHFASSRLIPSSYRRMKLVEELSIFCRETSIHGLRYIAKSPSKAVRIAWIFLFSASLTYAIIQIAQEAKCK